MGLEQIDSFMASIGTLESGNNYGAIGPQTATYGRARGRYQIMEKIYPAWAREAGVDPTDFSPAAQDRVARFKMTQYYKRYGSWDLVAVAWFAGPGRADTAKKNGIGSVAGIKDVLGTDVASYVKKATSGMNGSGGATQRPLVNPDTKEAIRPARPRTQTINWPGAADAGAISGLGNTSGRGITLGNDITLMPDMDMPEEASDIEKDQIGQDTFGAILTSISNAAKGKGGQVLDLKKFLGMPEPEPMPIEEVEAELAKQETTVPGAAPPEGPAAPEPDHPGFAKLTDTSKAWTQQTLGMFPGLRFSSGYRSPEQNRRANGVPNSKHLTGQAADFSGTEAEMQKAAAWAKSQGAKVLIHDAGSGRHLHIEWP